MRSLNAFNNLFLHESWFDIRRIIFRLYALAKLTFFIHKQKLLFFYLYFIILDLLRNLYFRWINEFLLFIFLTIWWLWTPKSLCTALWLFLFFLINNISKCHRFEMSYTLNLFKTHLIFLKWYLGFHTLKIWIKIFFMAV